MRKPVFCICENKGADQLHGNRAADQRFCFPFIDSTIPLLLNPKFRVLWLYCEPRLCRTLSETPKTGFLKMGLINNQTPITRDRICVLSIADFDVVSSPRQP